MHAAAIRIRDRYQFQIKLSYLIDRKSPTVSYDLAAYIFVPPSLGVARENFKKSDFYNDLQTFVRLKTPEFTVDEIVFSPDSPLTHLTAAALRLSGSSEATLVDRFEHQVKLFCSVLDSSLEAHVEALRAAGAGVDAAGAGVDVETATGAFLLGVERVRSAYRDLYPLFRTNLTEGETLETFHFGDEFMSLVVEDWCCEFLQLLPGRAHEACRARLLGVVKSELCYRRQRGYPSIPDQEADNEAVVYRRSVLKNYMRSVLLLRTRTQEADTFVRESLLGIAAGVSMMFATGVLFVSQSVWGPLTMPVFVALVVGYIFKDRLKELLRIYLSRKLASSLFDHKTHIYISPRHRIGMCKESFDFVDESKLPVEVSKMRNRDHITEIEDRLVGERVLRYRKHVSLDVEDLENMYGQLQFDGLNDVLRFNVHEFVNRMGAPRTTLYLPAENGFRRLRADRVYHLNFIFRQRLPGASIYRRFRVVLNRRGIKRIDRVSEAKVAEPSGKAAKTAPAGLPDGAETIAHRRDKVG